MTIKEEKRAEENHHARWAETIRLRHKAYKDLGDWWPFVQNVEDILDRIDHMTQRFDDMENRIGEVDGKIKNLRKILIKLEVIDDRFIF